MESLNQYEAFEKILKAVIANVPVWQANMPFTKMDELARAAARTVTYLFFRDVERIRSGEASGVHDVVIEVNLFGPLEDIDGMAAALNSVLLNEEVETDGWLFSLVLRDKKDIWEPDIKSKRIWLQYGGLMIWEGS